MFQNKEVKEKLLAVLLALLAAALYAISVPLSKLLLERMGSVFLSSFLYLGAGIGIGIMYLFTQKKRGSKVGEAYKKGASVHGRNDSARYCSSDTPDDRP